eukprot:1160335-Pelagomonas_calceolata.AAC.7
MLSCFLLYSNLILYRPVPVRSCVPNSAGHQCREWSGTPHPQLHERRNLPRPHGHKAIDGESCDEVEGVIIG